METARRALAGGDLVTAEQICQQILSATPQHGGAWALLTETALQRGRPDAAIVCANRAVGLTPDDPIAHVMRAKCLLVTGEAADALREAEAARRSGLRAGGLDALGAIFGLLGRHARALELFRRAVAARPDVPQYLFNLAATERMTGMLDAAEAPLRCRDRARPRLWARSLPALRPADPDRRAQPSRRWASALARKLGSSGRSCSACAGQGIRGSGPARARRSPRSRPPALQQRSVTYDAGAEIAEIDRIIRTQTRAWLAACPAGFSGAEPVFVVGLPRTSTTWWSASSPATAP